MAHQNSSTSNFKRFCLKFVLPFLLLFVVCGSLFQYIFEKAIILKTGTIGAYKVNRIINEFHPDEIAMFGSSRMAKGIIPDVMGPNYFNYGLNGAKDNVMLFFLNEEVKKHKHTPIIINLDTEGLTNSIGYILYYLYNINYKPVKDLVGRDDKLYYHLPFVKYHGTYELYFKDSLSNRVALTKYSNKGASIEKNVLLPAKFAEIVKQRENTETTFVNNPALLSKLIHIIINNPQRKFIFVVAPCHTSCFKKYKNQQDEIAFFNSLRTYKNAKLIDFSKAAFADSLFFDTQHLNYYGALKYSKMLKDTLPKL